jgi:hypothetical protein
MAVKIDMITCPEWAARKPKSPPVIIPKSRGIIFHHTAGHHPEISNPSNESVAECIRFAKDIQRMHMAPGGLGSPTGGNDSGHNFLVCRNGVILQGRWLTVSAIEAGHMVASAHCPRFNDWIGIEHEHISGESMTVAQRRSSARLQAWIADQYMRATVLQVDPHKKHFPTECPGNLISEIPRISKMAQQILAEEGEFLT